MGLTFAKEPIKYQAMTGNALQANFKIPAGDPNYELKSAWTAKKDVELIAVMPHPGSCAVAALRIAGLASCFRHAKGENRVPIAPSMIAILLHNLRKRMFSYGRHVLSIRPIAIAPK